MARDHCSCTVPNEVKRLMSHHLARDQWSEDVGDSFHYSAMTNHWNVSLLEWVHVSGFARGESWSARQALSFESIHDHTLMMYCDYVLLEFMCVHRSGHYSTEVHFQFFWQKSAKFEAVRMLRNGDIRDWRMKFLQSVIEKNFSILQSFLLPMVIFRKFFWQILIGVPNP